MANRGPTRHVEWRCDGCEYLIPAAPGMQSYCTHRGPIHGCIGFGRPTRTPMWCPLEAGANKEDL
jgi:hypothetical protein